MTEVVCCGVMGVSPHKWGERGGSGSADSDAGSSAAKRISRRDLD